MSVVDSLRRAAFLGAGFFALGAIAQSCSATSDTSSFGAGGDGDTGGSGTGNTGGSAGGLGVGGGAGGGGPTGSVPQTCAEAIKQQSYIGCEYWPTVTSNGSLYNGFEFAIAFANPTKSESVVTVERNGSVIATSTVAPDDLQTVKLPWVPELKQQSIVGDGSDLSSTLSAGGGYKVSSSVPVTMYQFNPLEFELPSQPQDCPLLAELGGCFSFTNDASLMLPKSALRGEYYVMSYPTLHIALGGFSWVNLPGFVAITGTENETAVAVTSSANVRSGPGVTALSPGQTGNYVLQAGDVLMLMTAAPPPQETPQPGKPCFTNPDNLTVHCPTAAEYDLTGTHVVADKPVSVIGGHDCSFVPFDRFACDHLEESMFPVEALGQDLIVTAPKSVPSLGSSPGSPDSMFLRVLSAADDNTITFDPAVSPPVTLNAGKWVEVGPIASDVRIKASNKILVGQYMVGEDFTGASVGAGDPSLSIAIPTEQYRLSYTFLAPSTYTQNLVNVVAPTGATITIDGTPIPANAYTPIGSSGMSVARHEISGGTHSMSGDKNFGIVVYGYGSYTSYMYPGGLNLETIEIVPQ